MPCTRWITPTTVPKRFTTQMYIYMLPIAQSNVPSEIHIPTPDGGVEHTAALFAPAQEFLKRARENSIILFPPQVYLLHLLTKFLTGPTASLEETKTHFTLQRRKLRNFIKRVPTAETEKGKAHSTAAISWADKVMSPVHLLIRQSDQRIVLALDKPGPELKGTDRGGDWDRVALVKFSKAGPREVEIRRREDVLAEEKEHDKESSKL